MVDKPYAAINADCLDVMKRMADNSVDAIVTDPPYGISFMGKGFDTFKKEGMTDNQAFQADMTPLFKEMLRVAKPGAHLLAFGGTRTYHRLVCAIEDAGWECRDQIIWCYSSGFPKSMDISKAIDKKLGAERASRGGVGDHEGTVDFGMKNRCPKCGKPYFSANPCTCPREDLVPITEDAKKWHGWGTCLKPAFEPIVLARKPLEGTVVDNVLKWGVGGLNIDECRVPSDDKVFTHGKTPGAVARMTGWNHDEIPPHQTPGQELGRFPANPIHDGSNEVLEVFPDNVKGGTWNNTKGARHFENNGKPTEYTTKGADKSVGSAARFFYCPNGRDGEASADKRYTDKGNTNFAMKPGMRREPVPTHRCFYCPKASKKEKGSFNSHPTVKPLELMKYLVTMVAPKGSLVLDPFMGSGSTGVAAIGIGRRFLGIEKEKDYFDIAEKRLKDAKPEVEKVV